MVFLFSGGRIDSIGILCIGFLYTHYYYVRSILYTYSLMCIYIDLKIQLGTKEKGGGTYITSTWYRLFYIIIIIIKVWDMQEEPRKIFLAFFCLSSNLDLGRFFLEGRTY